VWVCRCISTRAGWHARQCRCHCIHSAHSVIRLEHCRSNLFTVHSCTHIHQCSATGQRDGTHLTAENTWGAAAAPRQHLSQGTSLLVCTSSLSVGYWPVKESSFCSVTALCHRFLHKVKQDSLWASRPMGWYWSPFLQPSARHQFTLRDHGFGAIASHGAFVYVPAFLDTRFTYPQRDGQAEFTHFFIKQRSVCVMQCKLVCGTWTHFAANKLVIRQTLRGSWKSTFYYFYILIMPYPLCRQRLWVTSHILTLMDFNKCDIIVQRRCGLKKAAGRKLQFSDKRCRFLIMDA